MASEIINLKSVDPFLERKDNDNKVHIRIQQRNKKKCILTVQGLNQDLDVKRICKALRQILCCNGAVKKDTEYGDIIQLQGDHRQAVKDFFVKHKILDSSQCILHGY
jgi:translation initiation factor 1